ncbi:hypothetical protein [Deinococcus sp. KNUC1210]|nr:hypothetical protein [Deinococcus sp. KNUC1210]
MAYQADIRFNWKPEKVGDLKEQIDELIATLMEDIEVDDFLST